MAKELKKRTLTNLYNARPQWLDDAHKALDAAVAAAYGWREDIGEDEAMGKLLGVNWGPDVRNDRLLKKIYRRLVIEALLINVRGGGPNLGEFLDIWSVSLSRNSSKNRNLP